MKILIVKTSSMGDIIHAFPIVSDILYAYPQARIHWLAEESFSSVVSLHPSIRKVHVCAFRRWRRSLLRRDVWREMKQLAQRLREEAFDLVIDEQGLLRSAWIASWTKAPVHGFSKDTVREPLATRFYQHTYPIHENEGAVRRYRMLAAAVLSYPMPRTPPHFALQACADVSITQKKPYVSLVVNTSREEKLWPERYWVALGQKWHERGYTSVLYWGNAQEKERVQRIAAKIPDSVVAPRRSLDRTAVWLQQGSIMIGVDTGLAHLAAALGVPSVGIFVSTRTDILHLIGDSTCVSLGDVGKVPTLEEVWQTSSSLLSVK